ncbi:MAG: tetratricopeptide repeat protein [Bacteroidetes bacterium]|nr:tetratricopeptide repeat protein [Bacteroidota bacterium]
MKQILLICSLLLSFMLIAQEGEKERTVSEDACVCLNDVELESRKADKFTGIKECIEGAILSAQLKEQLLGFSSKLDSLESQTKMAGVDTIAQNVKITLVTDLNYEEVEEDLLRNCSRMQDLMSASTEQSEFSVSDKKRALALYNEGMEIYEMKDYQSAIKKFKKAIRKDKTFAFAYDMVGISYRLLDNYPEALNYYNQSLEIDPNGRMPLTNKPIVYALMGEFDKSVDGYEQYIKLYPGDPEGYYGVGRIYHLVGNYEAAADNMMKAYNMYNEISSPYARDAEANLGLYYQELKDKNQLEIFNKMAEKHNITIED